MSPRNQFENNETEEEEPEVNEVPLTLGIGGPAIGKAVVDKNGNVSIVEITDENVKRKLGELGSLSIADPADRYRSMPINSYTNSLVDLEHPQE